MKWSAIRQYTFRLEHRQTGGGPFQPVFVGSEKSFSHGALPPGTSHEYRVVASVAGVSGEVSSAPSAVVSATTLAWKQAFAATLSTNPAQRDGECIVQLIPAPLENGGTKVRITLRG